MKYDCLIIGAGLSGLTAASLLAKRGLSVAVCEQASSPGGSCGIFKRHIDGKAAIFDQGSSMLFGFGKDGFNAHRFLFNCLEEPFHVIRHDKLYAMDYSGHRIEFTENIEAFTDALGKIFPGQTSNIKKFYNEMHDMYEKVISENPSYTTPDEMDITKGLFSFIRHPIAYGKFLSYMNMSAKQLLMKYFDDHEILKFFDKLTSTYCYASVSEAPAILAAVMFIDNHTGGSWYPAGSTLFLPGILEKVIEENDGQIYYDSCVERIIFNNAKASGVLLANGTAIGADNVIYSGTVWDLYGKLLPDEMVSDALLRWAYSQEPTYPCLVFYGLADKSVIPADCCAVEMLASDPGVLDEKEITVYIPSIDDHTLCDENHHIIIAIGPSFINWGANIDFKKYYGTPDERYASCYSDEYYSSQKEQESARIINILEKCFAGISEHLTYHQLASPFTVQRFTMKNGGAAAGPKQMLGQHMMKRQPIRTKWQGLYCCGESTTMGTGTPTVTVSGITAANAVLKKKGLKPYKWTSGMKDHVVELDRPVTKDWIYECFSEDTASVMKAAGKCMYCESPSCCKKEILNVPGIMRRASCGNMTGAYKIITTSLMEDLKSLSENCPFEADPSEVVKMICALHEESR
ncbi:MAG: NAD(P)/FAD-dependent oxidoreductase [Bacillota bacterium]|nr:NAD(P)/FAD-dependent oxidoreductase [Bacillota bacterium]